MPLVKHLLFLPLLLPALAVPAEETITTRTDAVGNALNRWARDKTAAGFHALRYENRDGGHSMLPPQTYTGLGISEPAAEDKKAGRDKGPAFGVRPEPTIGNCSMAGTADGVGSLARAYLVDGQGELFLFNQYLRNNLIIYPEHQDYDPGANGKGGGWGDMFPANTVTMLVSQGSSSSDMPFVKAFFSTAAAFTPDIQAQLLRQRILMPTLQAIFRQSNKQVTTEAEYFTGKAHPPVFDSAQLDELKMITIAHTMTSLAVPPLAFVEATSERQATPGRDFFEGPRFTTEKLGDTSANVARIFRSSAEEYTLGVSARRSVDTMKRPLHYRWAVLQGQPDLVHIDTASEGREATLHVRWHPAMLSTSGIRTHRVDVGLFVSNGIGTSAPAIISFYMLPNERRHFDAQGRLTEICYEAGNPETGLPQDPGDPRWLIFAEAAGVIDGSPVFSLLDSAMQPAQRNEWAAAWLALRGPKAAADKLASAPDSNKQKIARQKELRAATGKALSASLCASASAAIETIAERPNSFIANQADILALAAQPSRAAGFAAFRTELKRLTEWGVLVEQDGGVFSLARPAGSLTAADRDYLRELHLIVLGEVLLPGLMDRSPAPLFVDPRLSTPKSWRDVYRYNDKGERTGWIRHSGGHTYRFDAQGQMLNEADEARPVTYREENGHVVFDASDTKN